ncbi:conserved hypothetical protein [Marinobacter salarius]|nr:conserved hypothetical protein [Marinobacter salarius]VXB61268.1 conserved hypothetical protein [Marinobacter salarius]
MSNEVFKLYAGEEITIHSSLDAAKKAAKKYMPTEKYLRIEEVDGELGGDWWAYEYDIDQWAPS